MIPWFNIQFPGFGVLTIHLFGILVAIGIITGAALTRRRGRELGLVDEEVASMITTVLVCGFIFAHVFAVVAYQLPSPNPPTFLEALNPFSGLSSFGGFLGALGGLFYWCKKRNYRVMPYADSLAYGLATGWMFGRLGCFSAHDHPGRITDFVLGVRYPAGVVSHWFWVEYVPAGVPTQTRHDLGLYEAIWAAAISLTFYLLSRRKRPMALYLAILTLAYAPVRFALDALRATDVAHADTRYFGLTPAQYGTVGVLVAGALVVAWMRRPHDEPAPAAAPAAKTPAKAPREKRRR